MSLKRLSPLAALALVVAGCGGENLPPLPEIKGPACPVSSPAAFAQERGRLKTYTFNDLIITRRSGHGSCMAYDHASLCYLSAPKLLHVSHKGRDWWFEPGVGERVILAFSEGRPRCVIDRPQTTEALGPRAHGRALPGGSDKTLPLEGRESAPRR